MSTASAKRALCGATVALLLLPAGCSDSPSQSSAPPAHARGAALDGSDTPPPTTLTSQPSSHSAGIAASAGATVGASAAPGPPGELPPPTGGVPDRDRKGFLGINWGDVGGFKYDVILRSPQDYLGPDEGPQRTIPQRVLELNKKNVSITGFMMPVNAGPDGCSSFVLVRDRVFCCYGMPPGLTDWIMVQMQDGRKVEYRKDTPTTVFGELDVSPDGDKIVYSLFRISASDAEFPQPH